MLTDLEREARFERQVLPLVPALTANAMKLYRNRENAEDLVQDTLLRAFQHLHQYQNGTNIRAWLMRIQTNLFISDYRKRQRRPGTYVLDEPLADMLQQAPGADSEYLNQNLSEPTRTALMNMPKQFRDAVYYVDLEGFNYKETAQLVGCPIGTIMSRLHRGRRMLRRELTPCPV